MRHISTQDSSILYGPGGGVKRAMYLEAAGRHAGIKKRRHKSSKIKGVGGAKTQGGGYQYRSLSVYEISKRVFAYFFLLKG